MPTERLKGLPWIQLNALIVIAYLAMAFVSVRLMPPGSPSPFWAPTGLAFAACILHGRRAWTGILIGGLLSNHLAGIPPLDVLGIGIASSVEAALAAAVLRRTPFEAGLGRGRDVVLFLVACFLLASSISPSVATLVSPALFGLPSNRLATWVTWWAGGTLGALIVAPAILVWRRPPARPTDLYRAAEAIALVMLTLLVSFVAFHDEHIALSHIYPIAYLHLPILIWAALRFGQHGTTLTSLIIALMAAGEAVASGSHVLAEAGLHATWHLQTDLSVMAASTMLLAAAVQERAQVGESLRRSEARLHAALENVPFDFWITDQNLVCVLQNPFARNRWGDATGVAISDPSPLPAEVQARLQDQARRALTGEVSREEVTITFGGQPVVFVSIIAPIWDGDTVIGTLGANIDITDRKQAELERDRLLLAEQNARAEAEAAARSREDFLSIAAHELRTPVTSLHLAVQMLADAARKAGFADTPAFPLVGNLSLAERQSKRLASLINVLLDATRIASGHWALHPEPVDLAALLQDVAHRLDSELDKSGSPLSLEAVGPIAGHWDRLRLEQVVTNLVSNAIKYGNGQPIVLSARSDGATASLQVRDHGIGIPPERQRHIFERFGRAVSDRNYGGFGLGLWIVAQIVQAHQGTIEVESIPGQGTCFTVTLPQAVAVVPTFASQHSANPQG